jgi:oligo-alginate lyase
MESIFFPDHLIDRIRQNCENAEWARDARDRIVIAAQPWKDCPDQLLWKSMFGPSLKRSWQVWSNGHCPACKGDTPMYDWIIDPSVHAWKVRCPHCEELFPKNDFKTFYESGLDRHGVFDSSIADRSLLVVAASEKPTTNITATDGFGVDDGNGYCEGEHTWMFIATYLIYGQWKQFVQAGIERLADAYTVTGDVVYARKAGILLDRVADLYPEFDFKEQGWLYEKQPDLGYVTNWHDACKEVQQMAASYDQVRPALLEDAGFLNFVQSQATAYALPFKKDTADDITMHIEERIFRDTIKNVHKIKSNFPGQEIALITMEAVLERTLKTDSIQEMLDAMIEEACAVDSVTGEKGLENYSALVLHFLANFLAALERQSPGFLAQQIERHSGLAKTYRFHIDTWCLEKFYPSIGDSGTFASEAPEYRSLPFSREISLAPSAFSFAWKLYELTEDADYVRVLHRANDCTTDGLPYDIAAPSPEAFQQDVQNTIDAHGEKLNTGSINFEEWHLAILRSGNDEYERAFWTSYDTGRRHGHLNGLSIGLFARGLDLLPDFGYLPVHRGGWQGPHVDWYKSTHGHNTVTIDGKNQAMDTEGSTQRWDLGDGVQTIKVSAPSMYDAATYERTCVMVEIDEEHFYIVDVFEVSGGQSHSFYLRGPDSTMTTDGLSLSEDEAPDDVTIMRGHRYQANVDPGWSVTWQHADAPVSVRYTGLSDGMEVGTAESWVSKDKWTYEDLWIPTLMVNHRGDTSRFVGVIDVYGEDPVIESVERIDEGEKVVVHVTLTSGQVVTTQVPS